MSSTTSYKLTVAEVQAIVLKHLKEVEGLEPDRFEFDLSTESNEYGPGVSPVFKGASFQIDNGSTAR